MGILLAALFALSPAQTTPWLKNAHAHNDYLHTRPLLEALEKGFTSVEADVFPVGGRLLVAHTSLELVGAKTLESLYLDPLERFIRERGKAWMPGEEPFWLMVDIKTKPEEAWALLREEIRKRPELFCRWEKGKRKQGPVWLVLSGSVPRKLVLEEEPRLASVDGRLNDMGKQMDPEEMPWISDAWTSQFKWRGKGPIPESDAAKFRDLARRTAAEGKQLRFWGAPDSEESWKFQKESGAHRIGTDKLEGLAKFLRKD